jgi:hypothetical protein
MLIFLVLAVLIICVPAFRAVIHWLIGAACFAWCWGHFIGW